MVKLRADHTMLSSDLTIQINNFRDEEKVMDQPHEAS